ncbi:MAG: L-2,4-diaminobutyric acid acetyltransferase [Deltaproteobacteria bacterium ADurb.Bin151]|nr:MAG: L-2,4-diaminobutyric acid acetyltransferase [Deltaproteobacteria bacterium ADurb.Bin151]
MKNNPTDIHFRKPEVSDAPSIERLVRFSPPLDVNSHYCYLIICAHFFQTSVVACSNDHVCGFISAYIRPDQQDTLFVWQVAVQVPIPLISPPDSEGIRHAIPMDVASLIRIMSPPL